MSLSCSLSHNELEVLNIIYRGRSLSAKRGYHSDKLRSRVTKGLGIDNKEFDGLIQGLLNKGFITTIGKSPVKYYISDRSSVINALNDHGYRTFMNQRIR